MRGATTITAAKAKEFFQDIVIRFGIPKRIITDNGTQFTRLEFKDWCEKLGIKICYASVAHPQNNGQVERANGMVLQGIKKGPLIGSNLMQGSGQGNCHPCSGC